jgi:chemotaxis protein methyltransferase CheR
VTLTATDPGLETLLERIERERGFVCGAYKLSCVQRRIRTRMRVREAASYEAYLALIDRDPREMDRLVDALTINVTRFFRNRAVWDSIAAAVVPALWGAKLRDINIWSAGCASGEEAFSLAMLFHRHAAVNGMLAQIDRVTVTATDVDSGALRDAQAAAFPEAALVEVPEELRARYFTASHPFQPGDGVRRMVKFQQHDLLRGPLPGPRQHLVMCRNVLIYFERPAQEQVIRNLQDSLEPGGYLILGKVESLLGGTRRGFEPVAQRERIFRRIS